MPAQLLIGCGLIMVSLYMIGVALNIMFPAYCIPVDIDRERQAARSRNRF